MEVTGKVSCRCNVVLPQLLTVGIEKAQLVPSAPSACPPPLCRLGVTTVGYCYCRVAPSAVKAALLRFHGAVVVFFA